MSTPGQDDGLLDHLPDCLPASARGDSLERPVSAREIQLAGVPPEIAAFQKRVEGLELHRRALLFVCIMACVASVTCLYLVRGERAAMAQPAPAPHAAEPGTLEVKQLIFVDAAGNRRDCFRLDESGSGIAFCDSHGVKRALFYTSPEGATGFNMLTSDGKQRVAIGVRKDGAGDVAVCDDDREHIVYLTSKGLALYEGRDVRGQFVNVQGMSGISIFDPKGRSRIGMGMTERGPTIDISDERGAAVFSKP